MIFTALLLLTQVAGATAAPITQPALPLLTEQDVTFVRPLKELNLPYFYPERAYREDISGFGEVVRDVAGDGHLTGCEAIESPKGSYFGSAVLLIASKLQLQPKAKDGSDVAGRLFRLHLTFGKGLTVR